MTVPINNLKISNIVAALGEQTSNVTLRNLHLSPNVIGSGLDPAYCPGADGYARLANLRDIANKGGIRSFYIGKFRNYNPTQYHYRIGHLYNGRAVYNFSVSSTIPRINIPSGWRLPTTTDWLNIVQAIEPDNNFSNNTVLPHLRGVYTFDQINPIVGNPTPTWPNMISKLDTYGFKAMAGGVGITINNSQQSTFIPSWFSVGSIINFWLDSYAIENTYRHRTAVFGVSSSKLGINEFPGNLPNNFGGSPNYVYNSIRLVKNNSTNDGYVEDVQGNVYKTIKIGNTVIMAEGLRTTVDVNGDPFFEAFSGVNNTNHEYGCYIKTQSIDIP